MKNLKYIVAMLALGSLATGCKKSYLDTTPSDAVSSQNLYGTTESCFLVLDGMERLMNTTGASYLQAGGTDRANDWGESTVRFEEDNLGQDMVKTPNDYDWFSVCYNYTGIRQPTYNIAQMPWRLYYKLINSANYLIDSADFAEGPADDVNYLMGQAYAYRAYSYYKLSLYYCRTYSTPGILTTAASGLPIYLHGTTSETKGQGRSTLGELYERIVSDMDSAVARLESVSSIPGGRTQADISLATAYGIYAKVALVMNNWQKAADMADMAITKSGRQLMSQSQYKDGFNSRSNPEWMWCSTMNAAQSATLLNRNFFSFVDPSSSTSYANTGIFTGMSKDLIDVMRTLNDVRKETFTGTRQQTKFHVASADNWVYDLLYMRLAEMYLIKAEALAEISATSPEAIATLETLVNARNPGYDYESTTSRYTYAKGQNDAAYFGRTPLLKEIYLQRRIELFMEGVAYSDIQRWKSGLKRPSGSGNFTLSTAGKLTISAGSDNFLFKIAQQEMDANPALIGQQNP